MVKPTTTVSKELEPGEVSITWKTSPLACESPLRVGRLDDIDTTGTSLGYQVYTTYWFGFQRWSA